MAGQDPAPLEVVLHDSRDVDVVLREYDYVTSMIPLYRGFQFRIVGLGMVVYGAVGALIGDAVRVGGDSGDSLMLTVVALLPWFQVLMVGALTMSEMRIVRASRYVREHVYTLLEDICRRPLMDYEHAPGRYLTWRERSFSTSIPLFIFLALPSLLGVIAYLFADVAPVPLVVPLAGAAALIGATAVGIWTTSVHELQPGKSKPAEP